MLTLLIRMTKDLLTVGRASKELQIAPSTLRVWCLRGLIPGAKRIGRWWRIPKDVVDRIKREGTDWLFQEAPHDA